MMCSASDLGTECANPHETRGIPDRILLYDRHPGGIGIASQVNCSLMNVSSECIMVNPYMHYA